MRTDPKVGVADFVNENLRRVTSFNVQKILVEEEHVTVRTRRKTCRTLRS